MPQPRKKIRRQLGRRLYIFCEGENTEPAYIERYKSVIGLTQNSVEVVPTPKNTPLALVKEAIAKKKSPETLPGDWFWVVFDRESKTGRNQEELHKAYARARSHQIRIAISSVCFEVWILLHFRGGTGNEPYESYRDLIENSNLREMLISIGGPVNTKRRADAQRLMKKLVVRKRLEQARYMAQKMYEAEEKRTTMVEPIYELNPYTNFHQLLDSIDTLAQF